MKATGIIVEYNPFHNGHLHHALAAKRETGADLIIAVMSGNFLQRGEPAFTDKWARTEMALKNGVDIVFELPYAFSTSHAPIFASGAISLLDAACCEHYCFGSEDGQIQPFKNSMALLSSAHTQYEEAIQQSVANGESYPKALHHAYEKILAASPVKNVADLTQPNNILGFHYLKAANAIGSSMTAHTIQRIGANYHDEQLTTEEIGSATAIRKTFFTTHILQDVENFIPPTVASILEAQSSTSRAFGNWTQFYPFLRMMILRDGPARLSQIADVTEGIENLIYRAALTHDHFADFIQMVKSKRYTWTRIQRMFTHIFTGYTYAMRENCQTPSYLRLLGATRTGRLYLNEQKKNIKLPVISKVSAFQDPGLTADIQATNMYALGLNEPSMINADFKRPPIFMRT